MPDLNPFPALRYDPHVTANIGAVLCPPYDIIAAAERQQLAAVEHNAVHLELPEDPAGGDRYAHAAQLLANWRSSGVLRVDDQPMIYVYEQLYRLPGASAEAPTLRARGVFCRLRLEEFGDGVLRHERTLSAPKQDRYQLLHATRTNLSPVLLLYRSPSAGQGSAALLEKLTAGPPTVETSLAGVTHRLWPLDPARTPAARDLIKMAAAGPLAIADGHHRYETALRYRDEVGGSGADHLLALVYDADSGGLSVLPTHRVLSDVADGGALLAGLAKVFELRRHDRPEDVVAATAGGGIGVWTRSGGASLVASPGRIDSLPPAGSEALRSLDVTLLASALEHVLGTPTARLDEQGKLVYTKDAGEAIANVAKGAADACFLLNATPVRSVLEVAAAGELMPPKSTYFVPKAATGLVFNLLSA